jgi:hypothetical protein
MPAAGAAAVAAAALHLSLLAVAGHSPQGGTPLNGEHCSHCKPRPATCMSYDHPLTCCMHHAVSSNMIIIPTHVLYTRAPSAWFVSTVQTFSCGAGTTILPLTVSRLFSPDSSTDTYSITGTLQMQHQAPKHCMEGCFRRGSGGLHRALRSK